MELFSEDSQIELKLQAVERAMHTNGIEITWDNGLMVNGHLIFDIFSTGCVGALKLPRELDSERIIACNSDL